MYILTRRYKKAIWGFSIRDDKNGESRDFLFLVILILPKYGDLEILSLHDKKKEVFREYVCQ